MYQARHACTSYIPGCYIIVIEGMNDISGVIGVAHIIPSLTALQSKDHAGGVTNVVPVMIGGYTCCEWGC